jgi:signal transduction histidine kinase
VQDWRDLPGERFDAIASIGMVEHVGEDSIDDYAVRLRDLLGPGGRLLNHGIARLTLGDPRGGPFTQRYVFPDGAPLPLSRMALAFERAGMTIDHVEGFAPDYAETLRHWARRFDEHLDEATRLAGIVDVLLVASQLDAGRLEVRIESCDAAALAESVVTAARTHLPDGIDLGLEISADVPAVAADEAQLRQVLDNLVDNAIKYAAAARREANGAPADVVVGAGSEGDRIVLTVRDSGPGIPAADRGRVVERFVRLEESRSQPGSGLGLSLASAVARLHGGELRLEDNAPGLKAVIELPRAEAAAGAPA